MDLFDTLNVSASGLTAQRLRMNTIASNLANAHTTRTPEGGPYKRKDVVFAANSGAGDFRDILRNRLEKGLTGVEVVNVIDDTKPSVRKFDPSHPDSDEKGYVEMPNINMMEEMVNMMSATRSYEANITAIKSSKSMAQKALEIGR